LKIENEMPGGGTPQKKRCPDFDEKNFVLDIFLSKFLSKMKIYGKLLENVFFWEVHFGIVTRVRWKMEG
jgi:hypothetical protein